MGNLLIIAGSNSQGRLVAPKTVRLFLLVFTPYIWTRNSVLTLFEDSFSLSDQADTKLSISSIKIIEFFYFLAILNNFLTYFSDSPTYLDMISLAEMAKKTASDSVAHALAKNVFPVPGGPYNKTPFQGYLMPTKIDGNLIGTTIASYSYNLALSNPAISLHLTLGFSFRINPSPESLSSESFSYFLLSFLPYF